MHTFTFNMSRIGELRKKVLLRYILVFGVVWASVLVTEYIKSGDNKYNNTTVWPLFVVMPLVIAFSYWRGMKGISKSFETLTVEFTDDAIRYKNYRIDYTIRYAEITDIVQLTDGSLSVRTGNRFKSFVFYPQMHNFDELRSLLANIKPLSTNTLTAQLVKYRLLIGLLVAVGCMVVVASDNKTVLLLVGVPTVASLLYSVYAILVSKVFKSRPWLLLLLLIATTSYLFTLCNKLLN